MFAIKANDEGKGGSLYLLPLAHPVTGHHSRLLLISLTSPCCLPFCVSSLPPSCLTARHLLAPPTPYCIEVSDSPTSSPTQSMQSVINSP